ncbi:hypothetical protein LX16_2175 [Stackebrandtia albiflava]|uniref:Uncharacterized protein n=1 Tax=Stackebrandtia albiflava TaxID=406432 RepID=A0A562V0P1_9ACTN|nr:hypothetical protein [Stackebrandtia albiflava]TWJ11454.1 hypothetical protein LX16_2175 [Stackebrandtia albiflava]
MGRTLGPFTDVSTARVDGAYEIYEGLDEEGRDIEILTLGISSSKDPSRRALLSDTVAWAHATRGPADAPILKADLNSEQPYVVTLRQTGYRGVERMLERMLAMGPATGPLAITPGAHTGQIPRVGHHTNPHGIPAVSSPPGSPAGSPVAPASPMAPYVTTNRSSRPAWLMPLIIGLALLVLGGGGFVVVWGMSGDSPVVADEDGGVPPASEETQAPGEAPLPEYRTDLPPQQMFGDQVFGDSAAGVVQPPGWPIAFRVPEGWECQTGDGDTTVPVVTCRGPSDDNPGFPPAMHLELVECPDECAESTRLSVIERWQIRASELDQDTYFFEESTATDYTLAVSRFFSPVQNVDLHPENLQLAISATGMTEDVEAIQLVVNDLLTQSQRPS